MIQFYAPDIRSCPVLGETDSAHCVRVLRMRAGDTLEVVDGRGTRYVCRLADPNPRRAAVEIISETPAPLSWPQQITVAVAPTKNIDRMEWMVEKLVEIGVNRIVPLHCRFSERKEIKTARLEKIAVSAMKQSLKSVLPEIAPMTPCLDFIRECGDSQRFIAYCNREIPRLLLSRNYRPLTDATIMIGPEGDFSPDEIRGALDAGFTPVSLGDNRLRTETAAIVACDTFHILDQVAGTPASTE